MSTERGSSSNANGIGDLALKITELFASSEKQFAIGRLISVPDHLRKSDEQAFTPLLISIGPIHHSNAKLQSMVDCKVQFCKRFIEQAKVELQDLLDTIRGKEDVIRSYYEKTIVSSISSDDFVTMILVDGMFILEYFLMSFTHLEGRISTLKIPEWMHPILRSDLVLLENQLPYFVLQELLTQAKNLLLLRKRLPYFVLQEVLTQANNTDDSKGDYTFLNRLAFNFFQEYNIHKMDFKYFNENFDGYKNHFTDMVRFFFINEGRQLSRGRLDWAKLSYSATQLHEAGIKFMVAPNKEFLRISFDSKNGVLEIGCIMLNGERIRLIRNIIALEQSHYEGCAYVTDFFIILDFLINSSKDVDLLCDKEILLNYLGDSDVAASVVNSLNTNILWAYINPEYSKICEGLNTFYKERWHRWKATLWHQYFSTPWRAASTSAAVILLLLTAIQTICSLKFTTW